MRRALVITLNFSPKLSEGEGASGRGHILSAPPCLPLLNFPIEPSVLGPRYTNEPIQSLGSGIPVTPVPVYLFIYPLKAGGQIKVQVSTK